jgi:GT2 family glycosyltransferase
MSIDTHSERLNSTFKKLVICIPVHGFTSALENVVKSIDKYIRAACDADCTECFLLISNSGSNINIQDYWKGKYEIISVPSNYYWSAAVQTLFVAAKQHCPTHILLMNHDIVLLPNSWIELIKVVPEYPKSILSGISIFLNTEKVENAGFKYTNNSLPFLTPYQDESLDCLPKKSYQVDALNGRFVLFPLDAANPLFLLPSLIPHYFADTVLSVKARREGFALTIIPTCIICADQSDYDFKKARANCSNIKGFLNTLFQPYSYRYILGNLYGQLLLVDNPVLGLIASVKYTALRIGKSIAELSGIIQS